jgi:hypothetical protein
VHANGLTKHAEEPKKFTYIHERISTRQQLKQKSASNVDKPLYATMFFGARFYCALTLHVSAPDRWPTLLRTVVY